MVNQKTTIVGTMEGYNEFIKPTRYVQLTVLTPDDLGAGTKYSPLFGRLGIHLSDQISDAVVGYFFAANKNEESIISNLISPGVVAQYNMPTNLSLDFSLNNYVCVGVANIQNFNPQLTRKDITITREGRQWVNLGIEDNGVVFDNVYYRVPGSGVWLKARNFPSTYQFSSQGELAIFDSVPSAPLDSVNANSNATEATAFYRHEGTRARGSVNQISSGSGPVGILYVDRDSTLKNAYIRFASSSSPNILQLQVLLDLNL